MTRMLHCDCNPSALKCHETQLTAFDQPCACVNLKWANVTHTSGEQIIRFPSNLFRTFGDCASTSVSKWGVIKVVFQMEITTLPMDGTTLALTVTHLILRSSSVSFLLSLRSLSLCLCFEEEDERCFDDPSPW